MSETADLVQRLVSCLPAATFEMEKLCQLAGIDASREVATAAVSCEGRPRLLVNPDFVAEYCTTDEHLFLLVMHELWHVLLAHTRLYPRVTPARNIAFDAIINAGLTRQHPDLAYRGFFERLNPADEFPGLLLRAPKGWPEHPEYLDDVGPRGTTEIVRRLYPLTRGSMEPLYEEILALFARDRIDDEEDVMLLGDHGSVAEARGGEAADRRALDDPLVGDVIRRIVAKWPPPPFPLGGRDDGADLASWTAVVGTVGEDARRAFARVLRRALGVPSGSYRRRTRVGVPTIGGSGVLPNARDRLAPARRALGGSGVLWAQPATVIARIPDRRAAANVYLDVSGSMINVLPHLLGLLAPHVVRGNAEVFQFSTVVEPLSRSDLAGGQLNTTRGTNIECVVEHLAERPRVRHVLILTDGYTGAPSAKARSMLQERGVRVHVVFPSESAWQRDLEQLATSITMLPPLDGNPGWRH